MMAVAFSGLSPDLRLFLSLCRLLINFLLFTAFLCIIHLISLCFSLIIFIPSYLYLYRSTPVNRSFHSSEQIVPLEWTVLFTLVHKPVHWSGTIQIQVGNRENALYSFLNLLYIYLTPILSFHLINKIFIFHLQYYLSTFT